MSWLNWPEFMNPGRLWLVLIVPLLLILYIVLLNLRTRRGIRFTNTVVLRGVVGRRSQWRRHVAVLMSLTSLAILVVAWARPEGIEKVPRERATIVLVLDSSLSMKATDVSPNRFDAAKTEAIGFLDELPPEFNVSVVQLSGAPSIVIPPTTDRGATRRSIEALALRESTALGDAIDTSLRAIDQAPAGEDNVKVPALIVLLSDGQNTTGVDPLSAATTAADRDVPVYTIAYGTDNGFVDVDGTRERVPPDKEILRKISQATDGDSWAADNASQLKDVYGDIGSAVGYEEVRQERTAQYALYSLAFAIVAALGAVSMSARWP